MGRSTLYHGVRASSEADGERSGDGLLIGYLHAAWRRSPRTAPGRSSSVRGPHGLRGVRIQWLATAWRGETADVEAPPRAQVVRVILTELNRIASHWCGWDARARHRRHHAVFYCFREREEALNIFEKYCGARLTRTPSHRGLQYETYDTFEQDVRAFCDMFPPR